MKGETGNVDQGQIMVYLVSYPGGFGLNLKDNKQALEEVSFLLTHPPLLTLPSLN